MSYNRNKIMADANLRLGHEALLEGHQGQMIFSSMFMFDRFEISSKPYIGSEMFSLHLQQKYFETTVKGNSACHSQLLCTAVIG